MSIIKILESKIRGFERKIIFPEGEDERVLRAAVRLKFDGVLVPILIGNSERLNETAKQCGVKLVDIETIDPSKIENVDTYINELVKNREGKVDAREAERLLRDPNYLGVMKVLLGEADGMVSGAVHVSSEVIRPALQIIRAKPGCVASKRSDADD